jgi:hypothetical protein
MLGGILISLLISTDSYEESLVLVLQSHYIPTICHQHRGIIAVRVATSATSSCGSVSASSGDIAVTKIIGKSVVKSNVYGKHICLSMLNYVKLLKFNNFSGLKWVWCQNRVPMDLPNW